MMSVSCMAVTMTGITTNSSTGYQWTPCLTQRSMLMVWRTPRLCLIEVSNGIIYKVLRVGSNSVHGKGHCGLCRGGGLQAACTWPVVLTTNILKH